MFIVPVKKISIKNRIDKLVRARRRLDAARAKTKGWSATRIRRQVKKVKIFEVSEKVIELGLQHEEITREIRELKRLGFYR